MPEDLTVQTIASFTRTHNNGTAHYTLHAIVKVSDAQGPLSGLALANFHIRMGEFDLGTPSFHAHPDNARFPGFYQLTQLFKFSFIDVAAMAGLLLCVQVKSGVKVGTGMANVSQIEMSQD